MSPVGRRSRIYRVPEALSRLLWCPRWMTAESSQWWGSASPRLSEIAPPKSVNKEPRWSASDQRRGVRVSIYREISRL